MSSEVNVHRYHNQNNVKARKAQQGSTSEIKAEQWRQLSPAAQQMYFLWLNSTASMHLMQNATQWLLSQLRV